MSVKMVADFRRKPSRARRQAAREERERIRAEECEALLLFTRNQLAGIDYGFTVEPHVVVVDPGVPNGMAYLVDGQYSQPRDF